MTYLLITISDGNKHMPTTQQTLNELADYGFLQKLDLTHLEVYWLPVCLRPSVYISLPVLTFRDGV